MELAINPGFDIGYVKTKDNIYEELKSRIDTVVLNSMKQYLRENNISFDGRSQNLDSFKENVIPSLEKSVQLALANIEKTLNKELSELTEALHDGSQTAFDKFAESVGDIGKRTLEMTARATAIRTAAILSPTVGTVATAGAIMLPSVIKTVKTVKKTQEDNMTAALDAILLKLSSQKDKNSLEIKYDIPQETMKIVAQQLNKDGININVEDTILFLKDITELDNKNKEQVVRMINTFSGQPLDVDKEIKAMTIKLKDVGKVLKDDVVSPLSTAALIGMNVGTTLSQWDAATSASVITALSAGAFSGNVLTAGATGGTQFLLSKFGGAIPIIGDYISKTAEKVNTVETVAATSIGFTGAILAAKVLPKLIYTGAKGTYNLIKSRKESKESKTAFDKNVSKKIDESLALTGQEIENKNEKQIALEIITDTLRSRGINISRTIVSNEDLKRYTQELDAEDKRQVLEVTRALEKVKEDKNQNLKQTLKTLAKTAYWGGVIALAGLGAYDAFINPGFIEGLRDKEIYSTREEATKAMETKISEAQEKVNGSIESMRQVLPDEKIDVDNFMNPEYPAWDVTKWFSTNQRNYENNQIIELLGLDTKEGLQEFLTSVDQKDPRLLELMDMIGVDSVSDLSNDYTFQASINRVGGGNWYYPDLTSPAFGEYMNFTGRGKRKVGNKLVEIINDRFKESLQHVPTKSSSDEEIIEYIGNLAKGSAEEKAFTTYLGIKKDGNIFDYISESADDYEKNKNQLESVQNGIQDLRQLQKEYVEGQKDYIKLVNKAEGYIDGATSLVTNDPLKIAGAGTAVGLGLGISQENSKNIFAKILDKIKKKISTRKIKALPEPQVTSKETTSAKSTTILDIPGIKVTPSKLKDSKQTTKQTDKIFEENDIDERE